MLESVFNKVACLQAGNFLRKRFQPRLLPNCFNGSLMPRPKEGLIVSQSQTSGSNSQVQLFAVKFSLFFCFFCFCFALVLNQDPTCDRKYKTNTFDESIDPAVINLLIVNNRNTRTRCKKCSKLTIKTPERH